VQIDTAVKSMVFGVESHKASSLGYGFFDESIIPCLQEGALMSIKSFQPMLNVRKTGGQRGWILSLCSPETASILVAHFLDLLPTQE